MESGGELAQNITDDKEDSNSSMANKNRKDIIEQLSVNTRLLFEEQTLTYAGGRPSFDSLFPERKDAIKRIMARRQYNKPLEDLSKFAHPLIRAKSTDLALIPSKARQNVINISNNNATAPELSIIVKDSVSKSGNQVKNGVETKSARDLLQPMINSIDKKRLFMTEIVQPEWHPPWKLYRMISGHGGWVHSLAVDPSNNWFASGCRDGLIKIWDIASGRLRITLTGHISGVRGLAVSDRHPYLFSCGDDKMVKCWDLEQNQVVRHYHGHLSGVYCLALHPTENLLVTGGRDSVGRVWDMRTKEQVSCLAGHSNTIGSIQCQSKDPQIITGSHDTTIRLWDLKMAKTSLTLTNHKKSIRALTFRHDTSSFASGATDNIKQWSLPDGSFVQNLSGHDSIINSLASNKYDVLVSGADNGTLFFWDWRTGYNFQRLASPAQRGSIESEAGILAMTFDRTGARLITGESDKTIKMFREDPNATEETHPIDWKPDIVKRSRF